MEAAQALNQLLPGAADAVKHAFARPLNVDVDPRVQRDLLESVRGILAGGGGLVAQAVRVQVCRDVLQQAEAALLRDDVDAAVVALSSILGPEGALTRMRGALAAPPETSLHRLQTWWLMASLSTTRGHAVHTELPAADLVMATLAGGWGAVAWLAYRGWQGSRQKLRARHERHAQVWSALTVSGARSVVDGVAERLQEVLRAVLHDVTAHAPKGDAC
ncbi:MAG: hypothetical protein AB2A00_39925 [Myxococcota bacterium]